MSACFSSIPNFSSCYLCLLLVLALFRFCLSAKNNDDVSCMDDERQALLQFKHGLVDEANRLASWVGDDLQSDCCKWDGIVCDNFTGHVHRIHLRGANGHCNDGYESYVYYDGYDYELSKLRLRGNLSLSLLHLKQLKHLDLSCNDFGSIQVPSFIGSLGNLRYLNLSNSMFGGTIPPQLGNLSELQVLSLGSFHDYHPVESTCMRNMQWLSSLRSLRHLDISGVDLSHAIDWLQVINTLPSLVELHLSSCQLSYIYTHFPSLNITSLSVLDLSFNHFYSFVPRWIFSLTSLVSLDLSDCGFNDVIPGSIDCFRNLTALKFLHVYHNNFTNSSLVLKGLSSTIGSNLISLDIGYCGISSSLLDDLHNLTSLLYLDMSRNQITKTIPKSSGNLCNLREINLSYTDFRNIGFSHVLESFLECKSPSLESLSIQSSNISGRLPDQLGQFVHLVYLVIRDNQLNNSLPDSIGRLSSLEVLDLSQNRLDGSLPSSIGRLSLLKELDLSNNQLNGSLPDSIGRLQSLEELRLSKNRLNGSLPNSFGQLSKLHYLDLSYNLLTGVVTEDHFVKLASLEELDGRGNSISLRPRHANWIPCFQLRGLFLNSWGLGPQFPLWLLSQRNLIQLGISNTNISAPLPLSFWRSFPHLQILDMSKNQIKGILVGIPAALNVLNLSFNEFMGQLPDLSNTSMSYLLDLSNNFFAGSVHHLLCPYDYKDTSFINLGHNHLSGVIPNKCWEKWPFLEVLNLENNNLSGWIPTSLGSLSYLKSLDMNGNQLSGRLPTSLRNLKTLVILQLGRNELVGSIPRWLGRELPDLIILNLRWNNFNGYIPHELCQLTHIHILDLAHNNLSGNIPRCFNNFTVLSGKLTVSHDDEYNIEYFNTSDSLVMKGREDIYRTILGLVMLLDLSSNNFSGYIPSELTDLRELKSLNLSRNHFTGRIPENIGDIKSLESFDVSLNKLFGELPSSLSKLSFLSYFNVSCNSLTGRIPSGTQLQSFNASSFFGNKLCGDPLIERCVAEAPDKNQEEDDESQGADWGLIVSLVLGFVAGFWIVMAPLIISRSWRIAYFHFLSKVRYLVIDLIYA